MTVLKMGAYIRRMEQFNADKIIPESGYITLIDNNNDGLYEIIKTESYSFMSVTTVNQFDNILYGANENGDVQIKFIGDDIRSVFEADTDSGIIDIEYYEITNGDMVAFAV